MWTRTPCSPSLATSASVSRCAPPRGKAPAEDVPEDEQREPEAGARTSLEREHRVRGGAGEERARPLGRERALREGSRSRERVQRAPRPERNCETRERARRGRERPDQHGLDERPVLDERADQRAVGVTVLAEPLRSGVEVALEHHRSAVVERVRGLRVRLHPLDVEVERAEERRVRAERLDRRAHVVHEAGQRQLARADAAAERVLRLVDLDVEPGACQLERSGEAVRARPDDDRFHRRLRSAGPSDWPPRSTGS